VTHAFFKRCCSSSGQRDPRAFGEQDLRHMGGLRKKIP